MLVNQNKVNMNMEKKNMMKSMVEKLIMIGKILFKNKKLILK